jgi:hypothetical protein
MPASDNMAELPGGFRARGRVPVCLRAIANDKSVTINADCWAGAAHDDDAILDNGIVGVIRVHGRRSGLVRRPLSLDPVV